MPAETQQQARQILKKVLVGPIVVWPRRAVPGEWIYGGWSRFEGLIGGGLKRGDVSLVVKCMDEDGKRLRGVDFGLHAIAGGSDAPVVKGLRSTDMAPHAPHTAWGAPAEPWRPSVTRVRITPCRPRVRPRDGAGCRRRTA